MFSPGSYQLGGHTPGCPHVYIYICRHQGCTAGVYKNSIHITPGNYQDTWFTPQTSPQRVQVQHRFNAAWWSGWIPTQYSSHQWCSVPQVARYIPRVHSSGKQPIDQCPLQRCLLSKVHPTPSRHAAVCILRLPSPMVQNNRGERHTPCHAA